MKIKFQIKIISITYLKKDNGCVLTDVANNQTQ